MAMTDAERLFFAGAAHARAAHALVISAQQSVHMAVPFYLLVGFSLEITLKAVFVQLGGDMKVAERDIRHDLPKALECASERGFEPENEQLEWMVQALADVHRKHSFRYLAKDGDLNVVDEALGLRILDDLVAQAGQLIYPEHDRAYFMERLAKFDPR